MKHHGLKQDYVFEDYAMKVFMKGKPIHGSYWEHLNVRINFFVNPTNLFSNIFYIKGWLEISQP